MSTNNKFERQFILESDYNDAVNDKNYVQASKISNNMDKDFEDNSKIKDEYSIWKAQKEKTHVYKSPWSYLQN